MEVGKGEHCCEWELRRMELMLCNVVKLNTRELQGLVGVLSSFCWVCLRCLGRARMIDECRRPLVMSGATPKGTPNRRVPSRRPSLACGCVAKVE